jgi:lysozyme family protein
MKTHTDTPHIISAIARAAIANVIHEEGGYVDDPVDRGGKTRFGISQKSYPKLDIASLTLEQAEHIYYTDYWVSIRGDRLPHAVALVVFDCAVNQGVGTASKLLQRAISAEADGIIGSRTVAMACALDAAYVCRAFTDLRELNYCEIVEADPTQSRFISGWVQRAKRVRDQALKLSLDDDQEWL